MLSKVTFDSQILLCPLLLALPLKASSATAEILPCVPGTDHPERVLEGLMRMHLHCERVSFEIPSVLMGGDMLLNTEFAGLSAGSDYVAPGMVADSRVVRWVHRGARVHLETLSYEMRVDRSRGLRERPSQAQ